MSKPSEMTGFSIIIPTYQEVKNIPLLIERIKQATQPETDFEVILIDDDSQDGTVDTVEQLKQQFPWLHLIIRHGKRSWAKSVLEGIKHAKFPIFIFMDADLSHPPEIIHKMLQELEQANVDMVIGSRYMEGGSIDKKWPFYRNLISRLCALMIRPLLPSKINDPLSGFVAIRKDCYSRNGILWNPTGTKIGLEIIVKSEIKTIREVPIHFGQRQYGESKLMNTKIALRYFHQVKELWHYKLFGA